MILAGNTFRLVQESLKQCASFSRGTILACPLLALPSSCLYKSVMVIHPKMTELFHAGTALCLYLLTKSAFIIFLAAKHVSVTYDITHNTYLVGWTNHPKDLTGRIERVLYPGLYFKWIFSIFIYRVRTMASVASFNH